MTGANGWRLARCTFRGCPVRWRRLVPAGTGDGDQVCPDHTERHSIDTRIAEVMGAPASAPRPDEASKPLTASRPAS
jgi:hypothetical protein